MENEDKLFEELWLSTNKITYMNAFIYLETEIHIHNMDLPNTPLLKGGGWISVYFSRQSFNSLLRLSDTLSRPNRVHSMGGRRMPT